MASTNLDFSEFAGLFDGLDSSEDTMATEQNVTAKPVKASEPKGITIENINAPLNPSVLQSAQAKMTQIAVEMNNLFVERDELVRIMQLAITTGTNLLMLGPPGTARFDIA